mmetsp:Transcript_40474/g.38969  ORF Transcript_40474/g.38969 Transcript_40474/m.38969 type:complete len:126 (-) Transcript_40474:245-622(-)
MNASPFFSDLEHTNDLRIGLFTRKDKQDIRKMQRQLLQVVSKEMSMISENVSKSSNQLIVDQVSRQYTEVLKKLEDSVKSNLQLVAGELQKRVESLISEKMIRLATEVRKRVPKKERSQSRRKES